MASPINWILWIFSAVSLQNIALSDQTPLKLCKGKAVYEYEMNSCPGGIQLRDQNRWFSKSREKACICGNGTVLQFDGPDTGKDFSSAVYPINFPKHLMPFQGSFFAYNLDSNCELLLGNQSSALFIDLKYFEEPDSFPNRPLELLVSPTEHYRLAGSYRVGIFNGLFSHNSVEISDKLKTVMFNTKDPVLITPNPINDGRNTFCAHTPSKGQIIVSKYFFAKWFKQMDIEEPRCGGSSYPLYERPRSSCKSSCINTNTSDEEAQSKGSESMHQFQKLFELMGEVSLRMKYSKNVITFGNSEPHVSLLQKSCRVFFRAFPNVVKWETFINAVTLFGISFEGLIPSKIEKLAFDHISIALGRCALQQKSKREENDALFRKICSKNGTASGNDEFKEYNNLIELLWQVVQFTQARCLPSSDHHPNVHHFYSSAMIELFSSPTVQLLWHQSPKHQDAMNRAMLHVFPELPSHALGTIQEILKQMDYQIYFAILQRPKIQKLGERDMRCAGHGKIIWGGKACCYLEEEDKKYYFYNRVSFAKL